MQTVDLDNSRHVQSDNFLRQKIKLLQSKVWRRSKALDIERQKCKRLQEALAVQKRNCCCDLLTDDQREFVSNQGKANSVAKTGRRWPWRIKTLAMGYYLKSPAAYKEYRKLWKLPHKNTLLRIVRPIFQSVSIRTTINMLIWFNDSVIFPNRYRLVLALSCSLA